MPTFQDIIGARMREQQSAETLRVALSCYVSFPSDEHEAALQRQIKEHRQRWMHLRIRADERPDSEEAKRLAQINGPVLEGAVRPEAPRQ